MSNQPLQLQIRNAVATVVTAGTRVPLKSVKTFARKLYLKAPASNAGAVYIGDSLVSASNGLKLAAGDVVPLADLLGSELKELAVFDLNTIYLDAATNGDKITYIYFEYVNP